MSIESQYLPYWARGRFLGAVAVLFVLQVGLILLFGDRSRTLPPASASLVRFRALESSATEDQLLRQFFVGDPAVFPLPNYRGFSGRGWLNQRPPSYQSEIQNEPPTWLELDIAQEQTTFPVPLPVQSPSFSQFVGSLAAQFGTNFPIVPSASEPALSGLAEQPASHEEPLPVFLAPEIIPTQSVFRLLGGLEDRLCGGAPLLRTWPSEKLLNKSVVQIAVDPTGEVIATRLGAGCGLAEADADAVAKAGVLRFRPAPLAGMRWGEAVFQWQTAEPAAAVPPK